MSNDTFQDFCQVGLIKMSSFGLEFGTATSSKSGVSVLAWKQVWIPILLLFDSLCAFFWHSIVLTPVLSLDPPPPLYFLALNTSDRVANSCLLTPPVFFSH